MRKSSQLKKLAKVIVPFCKCGFMRKVWTLRIFAVVGFTVFCFLSPLRSADVQKTLQYPAVNDSLSTLKISYSVFGGYSKYKYIKVNLSGTGDIVLEYELYKGQAIQGEPLENKITFKLDLAKIRTLAELFRKANYGTVQFRDENKDKIRVTDVGLTTLSYSYLGKEKAVSFEYISSNPFKDILAFFSAITKEHLPASQQNISVRSAFSANDEITDFRQALLSCNVSTVDINYYVGLMNAASFKNTNIEQRDVAIDSLVSIFCNMNWYLLRKISSKFSLLRGVSDYPSEDINDRWALMMADIVELRSLPNEILFPLLKRLFLILYPVITTFNVCPSDAVFG